MTVSTQVQVQMYSVKDQLKGLKIQIIKKKDLNREYSDIITKVPKNQSNIKF